MVKYVKSTYGMLQHTVQWFDFNYNDRDIWLKKDSKGSTDEKDTAIYFIHGTADQSCAFQKMARRFQRYGLSERISSMHLVSFDGRYQGQGIDNFAQQLLEKIKNNGHKRIILCGHSRGAVLAAWFSQFIAAKEGIEVPLCISIAGPFRGSYLAIKPFSYFSSSVDQMTKESEFLSNLRDSINSEPHSQYLFVIGGEDCIVPNRSGYILEYVAKYPSSLIEFTDHAHISLMTSTRLSMNLHAKINETVTAIDDEQNEKQEKVTSGLSISEY